jgi:hypothetical protein
MAGYVEHWSRDIDAHNGALGADAACEVQGRLTASTADIDDRFPFCWAEPPQRLETQGGYLAI